MGLDMYLYRRKYMGWEFEHVRAGLKEKGMEIPDLSKWGLDSTRIAYVDEQVGYWRKANAVHQWFVDNVQDGKDECNLSYVSRKKAQELLRVVEILLKTKDPRAAAVKLPPQAGFFFGSTDIDDYYWEDLENTRDILQLALQDEDASLYYQASRLC